MRSPTTSIRRMAHLAVAASTVTAMLAVTPGTTVAAGELTPADGVYRATITRTEYGIPHIEADDFGSLGFGQGYGAAEDIGCSLAETLLTGRAQRSKWFGPEETYTDQVTLNATNLEVDTLFGDIINQGTVEALVNSDDPGIAPSDEIKAIVEGYIAGANKYFSDIGGAAGITDPECAGEEWVDSVLPATPMDLYRGIYAANLLASAGVFVSEISSAAPPAEDGDSGLPTGAVGLPPIAVPQGGQSSSANAEPRFTPVPEELPTAEELRAGFGKGEDQPFGSNGTALSGDVTDTGRGMVLGNPHFPWQGRYRFSQTQLTIPGVYDVRGGMLHGSPVVNIGWTDDVAWTHTVSTAYRFTPYEYRLVPGTSTTYITEDGPQELERREVEVEVLGGESVTEDLYATPEGYVVDAPSLLLGWTLDSVWAIRDANAEHLKTLDVFHEMAKAKNVEELQAAQIETMGIPWVNTMAADKDGNILYADNSVTPHVTDEMAEQCMTPLGRALFELAGLPGLDGTRAQGDCAWGSDDDAPRDGIFGAANLPDSLTDSADPSWVINANDSYWLPNPDAPLEGFDRIIGCEQCERSLRTRMVYRYVMDRLDGTDGFGGANEFTHDQLMAIQTENRVFGAELAREDDDLQDVCAASDAPEAACTALEDWDGRTDVDSRGAILFREFFNQSAARTFEVPFDPNDPVNTPRDLDESNSDVIAAFSSAAAGLEAANVAFDATLGSQQKAGDDGAGDIAIHGGFGSTGNANVIAIRNPTANEDVLYPVSYGSSHIQAVAFTDEGVDGCTILTYGQSYDSSDENHDDQTSLWSDEEWVCWPDDVSAAAIETVDVSAPVAGSDVGSDGEQLATTGGGSLAALLGLLTGGAAIALRRRED